MTRKRTQRKTASVYISTTNYSAFVVRSFRVTYTDDLRSVPGKPAHHVREFAYRTLALCRQGRIGVFNRDLLTSDKQNKHS